MRRWAPEQIAEAMTMRFKDRKKFREIGEHFGATAEQVANLIKRVIDNETDRKDPVTQYYTRSLGGEHRPPVDVLSDLERRVNAPRTLSMEIFGDPVTPRWQSNAI